MRQLATFVLLACAVAGQTFAAAEAPTTTRIVQQRTGDGRILLTDRPAAGATTERSWQFDAEDPLAARQRALDVTAEANLVSERVQRRLEQQHRADQDGERLRAARLDLDRQRADLDRDPVFGSGVVLLAPLRLRAPHGLHSNLRDRRDRGSRWHGAPRATRFTGSEAL